LLFVRKILQRNLICEGKCFLCKLCIEQGFGGGTARHEDGDVYEAGCGALGVPIVNAVFETFELLGEDRADLAFQLARVLVVLRDE